MNRLTIVCAYYMNPGMLQFTLGYLYGEPVDLVIVDDGSPAGTDACQAASFCGYNSANLRIYRMKEDIPWNQDACRNLGVEVSVDADWILLLDMDHVPSLQLLENLRHRQLDDGVVYTFSRMTVEPDGRRTPYKDHPNSWLIQRRLYQQIGGYDERWRGIYGTDGMFGAAVKREAVRVERINLPIYRYPRETIPDASTTTLTRKSDENYAARKVREKEIRRGERGFETRGLTAWERVL